MYEGRLLGYVPESKGDNRYGKQGKAIGMKCLVYVLAVVASFISSPTFAYTYPAIDTPHKQDLIESAIRCEAILRPLWEELLDLEGEPSFQRQFMASDVAKAWLSRVKEAQDADMPHDLPMEEKAEVSSCFRDFTQIGATAPGFFIPIELYDAARAFWYDDPDPEVALLKAQQIQEWLDWAAGLNP